MKYKNAPTEIEAFLYLCILFARYEQKNKDAPSSSSFLSNLSFRIACERRTKVRPDGV